MSIPEYWVVDVRSKVVERYVDPQSDGYRASTTHASGEIELVAFPGTRINLAELWR